MWDPWEEATDVRVIELAIDEPGFYDPRAQCVVMASGLSAAMRRSVLAHELGHHHLAHRGVADPMEVARMELRARRWAANRLIDFGDLVAALLGAESIDEAAEVLEVDSDLVRVRISLLTEDERQLLEEAGG